MEALPYILVINGAVLALFVAWTLWTRAWQKLMWRLFPRKLVVPPYGASVRFRTLDAVYHSRFLGVTPDGWAIESIAEAIPAVRAGESGIAEISCESGVARFRTEIVELRGLKHSSIMRPPIETKVGNRRTQKRVALEDRPMVYLEGMNSVVQDISEGGVRLSANHMAKRGERVRLDIPGYSEPLLGYVVESLPSTTFGFANDVRMLFERPIALKDLKKKFAPAR